MSVTTRPMTTEKLTPDATRQDVAASRDAIVPVGPSCRLCDRLDCEQRAFPPLLHPLQVNEQLRGVSFYAPLTQHPAFTPNVIYFGSNRVYRSPDPQPFIFTDPPTTPLSRTRSRTSSVVALWCGSLLRMPARSRATRVPSSWPGSRRA